VRKQKVLTGSSGRTPDRKPDFPPLGRWFRRFLFSEEKKMPANQDFKDLFALFNKENVEYLVVGAHAVIFYSEPRYTKDLDVWINPSPENALKVMAALSAFGAPLEGVSINDFSNPEMVFQIGIAPNRIDILMGIASVDFNTAMQKKTISFYDGIEIPIISKQDLIVSKRAVGRPQDKLDVDRLEKT
jgi:hypothetical protein